MMSKNRKAFEGQAEIAVIWVSEPAMWSDLLGAHSDHHGIPGEKHRIPSDLSFRIAVLSLRPLSRSYNLSFP